jgi:hypothetical protein
MEGEQGTGAHASVADICEHAAAATRAAEVRTAAAAAADMAAAATAAAAVLDPPPPGVSTVDIMHATATTTTTTTTATTFTATREETSPPPLPPPAISLDNTPEDADAAVTFLQDKYVTCLSDIAISLTTCMVRVLRLKFALEDAIGSNSCSLEALP